MIHVITSSNSVTVPVAQAIERLAITPAVQVHGSSM